ncbi:MAG: hypothetical protein HUJ26_01905 [Planctomycetaceae bacterium]|nr:hypothetical protein [Planctomycetaceae bacterium]
MSVSQIQEWIAIQRNPMSGSGVGREELVKLVLSLQKFGYHVRIFKNRDKLLAALNDVDRRERLRCLVAAGGDGTVNDVLNRYPSVPLTIFPMGTENLLAKYLKIESSGDRLAEVIHHGRTAQFDVCQVNGRKFLLMLSFGIDADVVHRTSEARTGHISKLDYFQPFWDSVRNYEYPEIRVFVDDGDTPHTGRFGILSNIPAYALQLPFAVGASPFDGRLDLRLFEKGSLWSTMEYLYYVTNRWHEERDDVTCLSARRFRIESEVPVPLQVDGDPAGFTPVEVEVSSSKVTLLVPEKFPSETTERIPQ